MARLDEETSNQIFEELQRWERLLKAEGRVVEGGPDAPNPS